NDGGETETGDGPAEGAAGFFEGRKVCEERGADEATDGKAGREDAEALWADFQNVFGVSGQERGRAAEANREQVERNGGEDDFVGEDEFESDDEAAKGHGLFLQRR